MGGQDKMARTLRVDIQNKPRGYDILIGAHILDQAGVFLRDALGVKRVVVVTDENVAPLYLKQVEKAFAAEGHTVLEAVVLPAGEATKSMAIFERLMNELFVRKADRKTVFVALGGGVIGDITGFAGSVFMRGVDVVQIPTTLLSQVDSSVGGKTAIDTPYGKNTIGAFLQPRLVIADVATLETLPHRELLCGYAETVKYAFICDPDFFAWCKANAQDLLSSSDDKRWAARIEAVERSCAHKAAIVAQDELDKGGIRELLNLGHTFGHPLEVMAGYGEALLHGEAVAIGMALAFEFSARAGFCTADEAMAVKDHLRSVGLPVEPPAGLGVSSVDEIMRFMAQDKKSEAGRLTLVLARGIGKAFRAQDADAQAVRGLWMDWIGGAVRG